MWFENLILKILLRQLRLNDLANELEILICLEALPMFNQNDFVNQQTSRLRVLFGNKFFCRKPDGRKRQSDNHNQAYGEHSQTFYFQTGFAQQVVNASIAHCFS